MFLSEPAETSFDLRFWLFGTHVRVHPWFWLLSALLGWDLVGSGGRTGLLYLGVWILCVFVSILVHEFGHIAMGRLFGSHGHIVLYSFGGLAVGSNALNRGWQRFLVSFAGPLAGFIFYGLVVIASIFLLPLVPRDGRNVAAAAVGMLEWINLGWGLINLLPVWPLDGGQMAREVFVAAAPRNGDVITLAVSACAAGLVALQCAFPQLLARHVPLLADWIEPDVYMAILFGLLCVQSITALQAANARQRRYNEEEEFPWER